MATKVSEKAKREAYINLLISAPALINSAKVVQGIQYLGGVCDGSRTWDGHGFSKFDAEFGGKLADKAASGLSLKQLAWASWYCAKYHKQLEAAGIIGSTLDLLV